MENQTKKEEWECVAFCRIFCVASFLVWIFAAPQIFTLCLKISEGWVGKLLTSSSSPQLPQFSSDCLIPPIKTSAGDANTWHCKYGASADDKAEARLSIPVSWSNLGIPRIIREFRSGHFPLASRHVPLYIYWLNADVGWRVLLYHPRNIPSMHLLFADYMLQKWQW